MTTPHTLGRYPIDAAAAPDVDSIVVPAGEYSPGSAEEKRLVRKIDLHLVPMVWLMYIMSYLDRANIGNAKTGGMAKDLKLTSTEYSIALLVFFVGYVIGEVPSNMLLSRVRPSIYLPCLMAVWGCISIAMAGCHSYQALSGVRFILGLCESGFAPGVLFLLSSWYKKHELARRFAVYYTASALSGALGGLLAGSIISGLNGKAGLEGWRWLFIIEGVATVAAAGISAFFLPDFPSTTRWLTEAEKRLAGQRLLADDIGSAQGVGATHGHWASLKESLGDWRTWMMTFLFMMVTGSQTIQYFLPTLMTNLHYKGSTAQYMTIPVYMVAFVFILAVPFSSDKLRDRAFHLSGATLLGAISFAICIGSRNPHVQYVFICFGFGAIYCSAPLVLVWTSNIISYPAEKRAVTQAFVNAMGNSASIYGSFLWPANTAPRYIQGFATTLAMLAACGIGAQVMRYLNIKYPYQIPDEVSLQVEADERRAGAQTSIDEEKGESMHVEKA